MSAAPGCEGVGEEIEEGSKGINSPIGLSVLTRCNWKFGRVVWTCMPSFNQCCQTCSLTGEREGGEEDQSKTEGSSQAPGGCNGLMLNFM